MASILEIKNHPPKSYLSEIFVSRDREKNVLLSGCPNCPGYYFFLAEKGKGVQGTKEKCITW